MDSLRTPPAVSLPGLLPPPGPAACRGALGPAPFCAPPALTSSALSPMSATFSHSVLTSRSP